MEAEMELTVLAVSPADTFQRKKSTIITTTDVTATAPLFPYTEKVQEVYVTEKQVHVTKKHDSPLHSSSPQDTLTSEQASSLFLVDLWRDSITEYRRTARSSSAEEAWLLSGAPADVHYGAVLAEWEAFRNQKGDVKHKNLNRVKKTINGFLLIMREKIDTLDVLIGFPTQAV